MPYTFWCSVILHISITVVFIVSHTLIITKLVLYKPFYNLDLAFSPLFLFFFLFYCLRSLSFLLLPTYLRYSISLVSYHSIKMNYIVPSSKMLFFFTCKCIPFIFYYNRCFVLSLLFYVMIFVVIVFKPLFPTNFLSIY